MKNKIVTNFANRQQAREKRLPGKAFALVLIRLRLFCFGFVLVMFTACEKDKWDVGHDNRYVTEAITRSQVRLVNLSARNMLIVNGDTITGFEIKRDPDGTGEAEEYSHPGTKYFPHSGELAWGESWGVPQDLFTEDDTLNLLNIKDDLGYVGATVDAQTKIDNSSSPVDYYLLPGSLEAIGQDSIVAVPRGISAPGDPRNIKIRLLNFSGEIINAADYLNSLGQEDLHKSMTLTWADGTSISDKLTNIAPGEYSAYVEIPYGTYQLRVLTDDGREVPGWFDKGMGSEPILDPSTSTYRINSDNTNPDRTAFLTYNEIHSFKPGGVYSIVVSAQRFKYYQDGGSNVDATSFSQNGVVIVPDIEEPVNLNYGRVQLINAYPHDAKIQLEYNGAKLLNDAVPYAAASEYHILYAGTYSFQIIDPAGTTIATKELKVSPNENYSLWLYSDGQHAAVALEVNSLSGSDYNGTDDTQDGTYSRTHWRVFTKRRFLNLNASFDYATFTEENGQLMSDAAINVPLGIVPYESPYVSTSVNALKVPDVLVYRSGPAEVPGSWADEVPILTGSYLVARPALYHLTPGEMPTYEPGIYSIALIGFDGATEEQYKSKMMIVKHTK